MGNILVLEDDTGLNRGISLTIFSLPIMWTHPLRLRWP